MKIDIVKNLKQGIFLVLVSVMFTACLKSGLEDLPAFEEANITDVKFEYRYKDVTSTWIDGEPVVKYVTLGVTNKVISSESATITCTITMPAASGTFTQAIRDQVSLTQIVGKFNISTAATIRPLDGAPTLGVPGDFTSARRYEVTAADGKTKKTWTVTAALSK